MATTSPAAGEAPRSGGGGANPESYIGSLISLTSKSEIRYEGVLYSINTEESTIGLRNVQSFGTEGRKKDGPQIPVGDKVYEYILFRGSDIKDLLVKSSPPAPGAASVQNDPAIIQSHYPRPVTAAASLPSDGSGTQSDVAAHSQSGIQRQPFDGNLPLYQPGGGMVPWSSPPLPLSANGPGLPMPPMYWQGYYAPSGGFTHLQQPPPLFRPPPGLAMQQPLQFPEGFNPPLPSGFQNLPEFTPQLQLSGASLSQAPATLLPIAPSVLTNTSAAAAQPLASSVPLATPFSANVEPTLSVAQSQSKLPSANIKPVTVAGLEMSNKSAAQPTSSVGMASSSSTALITAGQISQPVTSAVPFSEPSNMSHMDTERNHEIMSKQQLPEASRHAPSESNEPLLPTPVSNSHKPIGAPSTHHNNGAPYAHHNYRGHGRGRGGGNSYLHSAAKFTEEFDFTAMNEKFNKDEVWGDLGKSKAPQGAHLDGNEAEDYPEYEQDEPAQPEAKPVYVKEDFFDSLSCGMVDRGARSGRPRFSEQMRLDSETFGEFARRRSMPVRGGGWGLRSGSSRSGPSRGRRSYNSGRGYGHTGQGWGHY